MVAEAITEFGLQPRDAVSYLKTHPDAVKQLQWYRTIPGDIARARIHILDITYRELHASKKYSNQVVGAIPCGRPGRVQDPPLPTHFECTPMRKLLAKTKNLGNQYFEI